LLFCVFGWISGNGEIDNPFDRADFSLNGWTSIVSVIVICGYSISVTIVIAILYYLLNKISWFSNLGLKKRSRSDTQIENIIGHLPKLAIEHELDDAGVDRYHLSAKRTEAGDDKYAVIQ
jgi:H+-transporting ATPase